MEAACIPQVPYRPSGSGLGAYDPSFRGQLTPTPSPPRRWYQLGAYYPFFRGHGHLETQRREPWLFGDEATARIRRALRERYAMLPYIYTLFRRPGGGGEGG